MSQLVVEPAHLDAVAQHSADAATRSGQLKVEDGLEKVKTAMRGGDSGDAATDAGRHVDNGPGFGSVHAGCSRREKRLR